MNRRFLAVCLLALASLSAAQLPKAPPATDLPRKPAAILPGEPQQTTFPNSCNQAALAALTLALMDQPPIVVPDVPCEDLASICESQRSVAWHAQAGPAASSLLDLRLRAKAAALRCLP